MVADDNANEIVSVSVNDISLSNPPSRINHLLKDTTSLENSHEEKEYLKEVSSKSHTMHNRKLPQASFYFYTYFAPSETDKGMLVFRRHILRKILQTNSSKYIQKKFNDAFLDRRIRCVENVSHCKIEICCLKDESFVKGLPRRKVIITGPKYGNIYVALNELERRCPQIFENAVFPSFLPGSSSRWPTKNKIMTRSFQSSYIFHKKCNLTDNVRLNSWENRIMPHRLYPNKDSQFRNPYFSSKTNIANSLKDDVSEFAITFENMKPRTDKIKAEYDAKYNTATLDNKNATITIEPNHNEHENEIGDGDTKSNTFLRSTLINDEELMMDTLYSENSDIFKNKTVVDPRGDRSEYNENELCPNKSLQEARNDYVKSCFPDFNIHKVCNAMDIRYASYDPPCYKNTLESQKSKTINSNKVTETMTDTLWVNNEDSSDKILNSSTPPKIIKDCKSRTFLNYVEKKPVVEVYNSSKVSADKKIISIKYSNNNRELEAATPNEVNQCKKADAKASLILKVIGSKSKTDTNGAGHTTAINTNYCNEVKLFSTDNRIKKKPVIYRNTKTSKKQSSKAKKLECNIWNPFLISRIENKTRKHQKCLNKSGCLILDNFHNNSSKSVTKENFLSYSLEDPTLSRCSGREVSRDILPPNGLPTRFIEELNQSVEDESINSFFSNIEGNMQGTFFSEAKIFGTNRIFRRKMKIPQNIYTKQLLSLDDNGQFTNCDLINAQNRWNCTITKLVSPNAEFYDLTIKCQTLKNFNGFCLEMGFNPY